MDIHRAKIIPLIRLPRNLHEFNYAIPDEMLETCLPGTFVAIPFRTMQVAGLVTEVIDGDDGATVKPVSRIFPIRYQSWNIQKNFFEWFARFYCVSRATALATLLPSFPKTMLSKGIARTNVKESTASHERITFPHHTAYCETIKKTLAQKRHTIVFFPTIHDCELFASFASEALGANRIVTLHSAITAATLFKRWISLFEETPRCVIATRIGAGVPLHNLDSIIIDSSERVEYNQYDLNPRYDMRTLTFRMQHLTHSKLFFSSVAPRIEEYTLYKKNAPECSFGMGFLQRVDRTSDPKAVRTNEHKGELVAGESADREKENSEANMFFVNMRDELRLSGRGYISEKLIKEIRITLEKKRGVFLFLNRTGGSRMITCKDCSYLFSCSQCTCPLRTEKSTLICDSCATREPLPSRCPSCRSISFHFIALGTEKIVELLRAQFSKINILEITQKTVEKKLLTLLHTKEGREKIGFFKKIIVGTSFLPFACPESFFDIGCIGILNADPLVTINDFRSEERQTQLLFNLARIAKSVDARFIVQTFIPNHHIIRALATNDYSLYAEQALTERAAHNWPPFTCLIRLRRPPHSFLSSKQKPGSNFQKMNDLAQKCSRFDAIIRSQTSDAILLSIPHKQCPDNELSGDMYNFLMNIFPDWFIDIDPVIL